MSGYATASPATADGMCPRPRDSSRETAVIVLNMPRAIGWGTDGLFV